MSSARSLKSGLKELECLAWNNSSGTRDTTGIQLEG